MSSEQDAFRKLVEIIDRLLAPDGCPWDQEQTVLSLSRMLLEEVCETIDTIRDPSHEKFADELGDVFVTALFLAKAAQKEKRYFWSRPFEKGIEKLIRRHPHIFGDAQKLTCPQEVVVQWEAIKAKEPEHQHRKSRFDGISRSLPALPMMQKLVGKLAKCPHIKDKAIAFLDTPKKSKEDEIARRLTQIILEADESGVHVEESLRGFFNQFRNELISLEQSS